MALVRVSSSKNLVVKWSISLLLLTRLNQYLCVLYMKVESQAKAPVPVQVHLHGAYHVGVPYSIMESTNLKIMRIHNGFPKKFKL